ncbi:cell division topological specificity factor MinE [Edwardsiella anguillarum]|nr:cell division topological specificity factor MinE [Edwardsiella anguillarum]
MALLDFFCRAKNDSQYRQGTAADHRRGRRRGDSEPHYLPQLKRDLLAVICKYVQIDPEMVSVQLEQKGDDISVLELNVTLPENEEAAK